jgi:Sec-independent protein secretion pathway component TatC
MWRGFSISVLIGILMVGILSFCAKWGRITAKSLLRNSWRAIFLFIVIGAALSQTTDPLNILFNAAPMVLLYALSVGITWFLHPARQQELE